VLQVGEEAAVHEPAHEGPRGSLIRTPHRPAAPASECTVDEKDARDPVVEQERKEGPVAPPTSRLGQSDEEPESIPLSCRHNTRISCEDRAAQLTRRGPRQLHPVVMPHPMLVNVVRGVALRSQATRRRALIVRDREEPRGQVGTLLERRPASCHHGVRRRYRGAV
jgi:hypothetical protein